MDLEQKSHLSNGAIDTLKFAVVDGVFQAASITIELLIFLNSRSTVRFLLAKNNIKTYIELLLFGLQFAKTLFNLFQVLLNLLALGLYAHQGARLKKKIFFFHSNYSCLRGS